MNLECQWVGLGTFVTLLIRKLRKQWTGFNRLKSHLIGFGWIQALGWNFLCIELIGRLSVLLECLVFPKVRVIQIYNFIGLNNLFCCKNYCVC